MHLKGVERGKGEGVRVRWKASYKLGNVPQEEQGEIPSLGIA